MPTMSLYTNILPTLLLLSILFASSRSGSFKTNRTKMSDKEPYTTYSVPPRINNGTVNNTTSLQSTTSILLTTQSREKQNNNTSTTITRSDETFKTSQPTLDPMGVSESLKNSPSPHNHAGSARTVENRSTVLAVSLVLLFCLSAVGVVAAVFFVRWKRIKKMKEGFQEEMAVICLHDELASEALYSSWKPFMNGNAENNKVKLVIETQPSDVSTT